jgi:division protein CdvB (Snf7/Vps24/ESCRT-III family)
VAEEQADLRRRIISANSEAAGLRADVRLLESERARAEGPRLASAAPPPEDTVDPAPPILVAGDAPDASPGAETPVDHGTDNEADEIAEEEAAEFLEMLTASQQRVRASLARDREMVEALGSELHDIRQQVTRLQAPM